MTPGELIRTTRARRRLSQARLARRAGTQQSAISRIEADQISPSVETLALLMAAMGEELHLAGAPSPREYDPAHRRTSAERPPDQRLALGISWNRMAGRLAAAGRQARGRR
jgi:transcriptional regulator with XRE-family HTH domain